MKNITAKTIEALAVKVREAKENGYCVIGNEVFKSENGFSVIMDVDYSKQPKHHTWNVKEYVEKFGCISKRVTKKGNEMVTLKLANGTLKEFFNSETVNIYDAI